MSLLLYTYSRKVCLHFLKNFVYVLQQLIPQWPEPIIPHLKVMWRVRQQRRVVLETIHFRLFYLQLLILSTPLLVPFYNPTNKNVVLWLFICFFSWNERILSFELVWCNLLLLILVYQFTTKIMPLSFFLLIILLLFFCYIIFKNRTEYCD